jgi:anti-sigma-K factor RskA
MTDELNSLAGAYALDALDDDERAVFEEHLADCPACTEEVRGLRNAAAELSHLTEAGPPPELRAAVLGAVAQLRPLPPRVDGARVLPMRRARTTAFWQGLAAACALIAVAVSTWGYAQHREAQRATRAQLSVVQSLLAAPDVQATTTALKQGRATVLSSRGEHRLVLIARGLPVLPAGRTYQLWMMTETGAPVSGGVFRPDPNGNVEVPASGDLDGVDRMGVSVEPAGGSAQPSLATVQVLKL